MRDIERRNTGAGALDAGKETSARWSERETSTTGKARGGEKETSAVKRGARRLLFRSRPLLRGFRKRVSERAGNRGGRERTERMNERASERHNTRAISLANRYGAKDTVEGQYS